jgi:hypothetical protein
MPFISIIHSPVHLAIFCLSTLNPVYTLAVSVILFAGWLTQTSIWLSCTMPPDAQGIGLCFQSKLVSDVNSGKPLFVNEHIHNALLSFGWVLATIYLVWVIFACVEMYKARMARKYPKRVGMRKLTTTADENARK